MSNLNIRAHEPVDSSSKAARALNAVIHSEEIPPDCRKPVYICPPWRPGDLYGDKVLRSDGFDVSGCTRAPPGGIIEIKKKLKKRFKRLKRLAKSAVENQNAVNEDSNLEFVDLVRANGQGVCGVMYYLTIKAIDRADNNQLKVYRAKVWHKVSGDYEYDFFQEAPYSPADFVEPIRNRPKRKKARPHSRRNRSFFHFVKNLKKIPEVANRKDVLEIASNIWWCLSAEEKSEYFRTGRLIFKDEIQQNSRSSNLDSNEVEVAGC